MAISSSTIGTLPCDCVILSPQAAGQGEKERRACAFFADYPGAAAMCLRSFLNDRQAEPGSRRSMPRFFGAIESVENALPIGRLDGRALIMYCE